MLFGKKSVSQYRLIRLFDGAGDPLDVALIVDGLPVLVRRQIGLQINGVAAQHAGYFWEGAAAHNVPPLEGLRLTLASRRIAS